MNTLVYGSSINEGLLKSLGPFRIFSTGQSYPKGKIYITVNYGEPIPQGEFISVGEPTPTVKNNTVTPSESQE